MSKYTSHNPIADYNIKVQQAKALLGFSPTADIVEVRHGYWIKTFAYSLGYDDFHRLECSECGIVIVETALKEKDYKHCLNCGAKMDEERREEPNVNNND